MNVGPVSIATIVVVVGELLSALLAFLLGVGDVAGHHLEGSAADAAGLLVDELDGGVDAGDVGVADDDSATLLVEVADLDRRQAGVGCARSADVRREVGDLVAALGRSSGVCWCGRGVGWCGGRVGWRGRGVGRRGGRACWCSRATSVGRSCRTTIVIVAATTGCDERRGQQYCAQLSP